jgi:glycosyltransferase involved in cell wall biosynthesis
MPSARDYVLISPCRNEADYMRRTLDSVIAQSAPPALWVIINDGSTDETSAILAEYAGSHDWITVVQKPDRGHRAVGPGVIEAFYFGLDAIDLSVFSYLCKLDLDLELPSRYFEILLDRMAANPRLGTCSGKPYIRHRGRLVSERRGDEMSVGMTKFYRCTCFDDIGGFVREVMWDAIDCHKVRQKGWIARSWDDEILRFEHLRPMGSSQTNIYAGRRRHGFGQYFMGSDPLFFLVTAIFRMTDRPYVWGGLATAQGYLGAWLRREKQLDDPELRRFIRAYQRRALFAGKAKAIAEQEAEQAALWRGS